MRVQKTTKLVVDILLTFILIALIYPRQTGFEFHEIAGLVMGTMILLHAAFNWSWIKSISQNLSNPKLRAKPKLFYLLDWISFLAMAALITTGIMISMVLFPAAGPISHSTVVLHKWLAYSSLVLLGLHLLLHWRFVAETAPRLWSVSKPTLGKAALTMTSAVLIAALVYTQSVSTLPDSASVIAAPGPTNVETADTIRPPDQYETQSATGKGKGRGAAAKTASNQTVPVPAVSSSSPLTESSLAQNDANAESASNLASIDTQSDASGDPFTLTDYLSNLFCSGCDKYCPLLALQCERGEQYLRAAQQQYTAIYGSANLD